MKRLKCREGGTARSMVRSIALKASRPAGVLKPGQRFVNQIKALEIRTSTRSLSRAALLKNGLRKNR